MSGRQGLHRPPLDLAKSKETGEIVSKIVPMFELGSRVTMTRTDMMYVATEYGVVNLKRKDRPGEGPTAGLRLPPRFPRRVAPVRQGRQDVIPPEHDAAFFQQKAALSQRELYGKGAGTAPFFLLDPRRCVIYYYGKSPNISS